MPRLLVPLLLAIGGTLLALKVGPAEQAAVRTQLENFPDVQRLAHQLRPLIAVVLCLLPAIGAVLYFFAGTLARYITRQFLTYFGLCSGGLLALWMVSDLGDNLDELKASKHPLSLGVRLLLANLPEVVVMLVPYALLLSILYTLGQLSRSREIVAMIQTGRGLFRLTLPFLAGGVLAGLLCAGLNYQWAPASVASESAILRKERGIESIAEPHIRYYNHDDQRLWKVGQFPHDYQKGAPLDQVTVIQMNPDGTLASKLDARTAVWSPTDRSWTFTKPRLADFNPEHSLDGLSPDFTLHAPPDPFVIHGWSEVPAQLIRPGLPAYQLGIPDLNDWLASNPLGTWSRRGGHLTQWHYRWAQPFICIIVVMLAVPLGIVFTRRGASGGVAVAIFLSLGMLFTANVCLALGDSGHLKPHLAAWLPNLIFGALAIWLFQRRLAGRPIYQTLRKFIPAES